MVDVVVLAGDSSKDTELKAVAKVNYKSLIPIAGKTMVEYVLSSLVAQADVGRIAVVGPVDELAFLKERFRSIEVVGHGDFIVHNLLRGIEALGSPERVLVVTADIPMVTPPAIEDFIQRSSQRDADADFHYSIVSREDNEKKYPGVKRTYVKLRNGTFTGGNIFLVRSKYVSARMKLVEQLFDLRKKPLSMCKLLGWKFVFGLLLGNLTIAQLEERLSSLLGLKGVAIISPYPEVGTDVDKPSDLELARSILKGDIEIRA